MKNLIEFCNKNWYTLKDKIDFNIDRYWDWNTSITTILKLIIVPWFDLILRKYPDQIKAAADKWTEVHSEAENFFIPKSGVTTMNPNFMKFHTLYNVKVTKQEERYIKDSISWKIDVEWEIEYWDSIWERNIDYKNALKHSEKYCVQLAWYKYLNWKPWILVYGKWKLQVIEVWSEYDIIFEELLNYFFNLLKDGSKN